MALQRAVLLAGLLLEVTGRSSASAGQQSECCVDVLDANTTCAGTSLCGPGMPREVTEPTEEKARRPKKQGPVSDAA